MLFNKLNEVKNYKDYTDAFYGLDVRPKADNGWMRDMLNLSTDKIPVLSTRQSYYSVPSNRNRTFTDAVSVGNGRIAYIAGNKFYYEKEDGLESYDLKEIYDGHTRTMIRMGEHVIVFPDNFYYTPGTLEYSGYDKHGFFDFAEENASLTFEMVADTKGESVGTYTNGKTAPSSPVDGQYWVDTSTGSSVLKKYTGSEWMTLESTYVKISGSKLDNKKFVEGMCIRIDTTDSQHPVTYTNSSGSTVSNPYKNVSGMSAMLNKPIMIVGDGRNSDTPYIVVAGLMRRNCSMTSLAISNPVPVFDYAFECENRIWGCRYGDQFGSNVNEVYASKVGDFRTYYDFTSSVDGCYVASLGAPGEFTGGVSYYGKPIFFKQNLIYRVMGSYPSNYQSQQAKCEGVASGESKSIAITDGSMYYRSFRGIMKYDGSVPTKISDAIGSMEQFATGSVAGTQDSKYIITLKDKFEGKTYLYVYDSRKSVWSKWGMPNKETFLGMCDIDDNVFASTTKGRYYLFYGYEMDDYKVDDIKWSMETSDLGLHSSSAKVYLDTKKYISQVLVRMKIEELHDVDIYIMYDDSGKWEHVCTVSWGNLITHTIPIRPKRCDNFRLRIQGTGQAEIYSITRYIEQGSER